MKEKLQNHILISATLIITAIVLSVGTWYVHFNQRTLETSLRADLEKERTTMISLAEITGSGGADAITEVIISDCARRSEYEALLVQLGTLGTKDILTLQTLSDACSGFYPERKALMVSKLEREYEMYTSLVHTLSLLTTNDIESYEVAAWGELIALEKKRSTLLTDQKKIQDDIISALITGEAPSGVQVRELVRSAQEINELFSVYNKQIDEKRAALAK